MLNLQSSVRTCVAAAVLLLTAACSQTGDQLGEDATADIETMEARMTSTNGIFLGNGLNLPNGFNFSNGVTLGNGFNLGNGISLGNGINLGNGAVLNGVAGPYIAPLSGSDLEKWIDQSPTDNQRLIRYLVQCALASTVTVRFTYRGTTTILSGLANLAPGYQKGLMTVTEQERVSACLLARVNAKRQMVVIDLFGPFTGFNTVTTTELENYQLTESAFFGNLFSYPARAYTCAVTSQQICAFRGCAQPDGSCSCGVIKAPLINNSEIKYCNSLNSAPTTARLGSGRYAFSYFTSIATHSSDGTDFVTYTWNNPITVRIPLKTGGMVCTSNGECASGACNGNLCA